MICSINIYHDYYALSDKSKIDFHREGYFKEFSSINEAKEHLEKAFGYYGEPTRITFIDLDQNDYTYWENINNQGWNLVEDKSSNNWWKDYKNKTLNSNYFKTLFESPIENPKEAAVVIRIDLKEDKEKLLNCLDRAKLMANSIK